MVKLRHWQIVLRKDSNLYVVHISARLGFKNGRVIQNFRLGVGIFTFVPSCAYELWIEDLAIESLLLAKVVAILEEAIASRGSVRTCFDIILLIIK